MGIRIYNAFTPGTRFCALSDFSTLTKGVKSPSRRNTKGMNRAYGRNNQGRSTIKNRGGGHKRLYRTILFKRDRYAQDFFVTSIEYDPNRTAYIARLSDNAGTEKYILAPRYLRKDQVIASGSTASFTIGNAMALSTIPVGSEVHNIELYPKQGGRLARAAGASAQLIAKDGKYATLRLPSGEVRLVLQSCWATFGQVGNEDWINLRDGKAGRKRWRGIGPHVRGSAKNPCDHPHGGGEGRAPGGRARPVTPWGKPALGARTRAKHRYSNKLILRRAG